MLHLMPVLEQNLVIEIYMVQPAGDDLAYQPRKHQPGDEGKLMRHFKDNENGCNRRLTTAPRHALMPPTASRSWSD